MGVNDFYMRAWGKNLPSQASLSSDSATDFDTAARFDFPQTKHWLVAISSRSV
jgi:hypothetical protein